MDNIGEDCDAIVLGAGHNGLCVGLYLIQQGYRTLILEKDDDIGGMASSDQDLVPGFWHHRHANFLSYLDLRREGLVDFEALGVETVWPDAQHGICFRDDRPPLILYRPDRPERSRQSIARFSEKDARMYLRVKSRADRLSGSLARSMQGAPDRRKLDQLLGEVIKTYSTFRFTAPLRHGTARTAIDSLFESEELRTLLYRLTLEFGGNLVAAGSDIGFLSAIMWMIGRRRIPRGGMSSVPFALGRAFEALGGVIRCGVDVARVVVDGGRASAVTTRDGRHIPAAQCIVATTSLDDLYERLCSGVTISPERRSTLAAFRAQRATSVGSSKFCLRTAPHYRASAIDPAIDRCLMTFIGLDSPEEVLAAAGDVRQGCFPPPNGVVRINSLWDDSQAPEGFHAGGADTIFPSTQTMDGSAIEALQENFAPALLECWSQYAPNMTADNVLAQSFSLSKESERKLLLGEGDDQYRSGVDGLFLAGSETFPGGGVHGFCAYAASKVIAADGAAAKRCSPA